MAGPWYVDPEGGSVSNNGLSAASPWLLIPGQTGATSQTGYAIANNDTIYIKAGTTTTLRVAVPAFTGLKYRVYGTASNVLTLRLPRKKNPRKLRTRRMNNGMWRIDARAIDAATGAAIGTSTRTGCVFEDVDILGPLVNSRDAVGFAASGDNVAAVTIRRFRIRGAAGRGIMCYAKGATIEYGDIGYTVNDNLAIASSVANGHRAGSVDTIRFMNFRDPNRMTEGAAVTGTLGDCFQTVVTAAEGLYEGKLNLSYNWFHKTTTGKQAITVVDCLGGAVIEGNHFGGGAPGQINIGQMRGSLKIRRNYFADVFGTSDNMLIRFEGIAAPVFAYLMDTGSLLEIEGNVVESARCPGLFHTVDGETAWEVRGTINIHNNTVLPTVNDVTQFSFASMVALWSASTGITYHADAKVNIRNNRFPATGKPHVILPDGAANDSGFVVSGNSFEDASFEIGAVAYATTALFEAAHSAATANITSDPLLTSGGRPLPGSPLLGQGADIGYQRDIEDKQSHKFIGAYAEAMLREAA